MKILREKNKMRNLAQGLKRKGNKISFVPTMGALHDGHIALLKRARRSGDILVLSIFVNPLQFGPKEDLKKYPRRLKDDLVVARRQGVDIAFIPSVGDIYECDHSVCINENSLSVGLCGDHRPGHFTGVTTVVGKLFNIVMPDVAVFGQKDYQQYKVIEKMVMDLDFPVKLVMVKTVRDNDGLALSSRNKYLSPSGREKALSIRRSLAEAAVELEAGAQYDKVVKKIRKKLNDPGIKVDYVSVMNKDTLKRPSKSDKGILIAVAVRIGKTRLIDNVIVNKQKKRSL